MASVKDLMSVTNTSQNDFISMASVADHSKLSINDYSMAEASDDLLEDNSVDQASSQRSCSEIENRSTREVTAELGEIDVYGPPGNDFKLEE
eukprot:CAMPEP_0176340904 /NCGR_PEP_ID=MMETSP0126-20121128/1933_1 /TAXON_ID=141414 ORGANISM="Strombidinopsis acuminatum, Strain SPMC142" /NCGR_SAMPLE_ID=MMETSP0126 /ASSEMBLY_ACC=CAM_ASM_000229 /LENGTH=91 /DNA_ID=CAMNT_0017685365 /DNA_START=518 /DNA_END=793 /DNA_ORIENTATION=-